MPRKVAHLVYSFGMGGLERVISNLVNDSNDYDVEHVIITQIDEQSFASQLEHPVTFYCLHKKDGKDLLSHWRLWRLLREIKPDVLHTYNFGTLEYQVVAAFAGVARRVHAEHGRESSYKDIKHPAKYEVFRRLIAPFLTHFVVVSQDLYQWGLERLKLSPPKLRLVYNGISLSEFPCLKAQPEPLRQIACVGRLVDVKNHALLIDAVALANQIHPQFSSVGIAIVGNGPNQQKLQSQIDALGLENQVLLLGYRENVSEVLAQAQLFVLSSRYEAQPMTALEAMASGLPVICTDVGGIKYVISHGDNGMLVPSDDKHALAQALLEAFHDSDKFYEMGQRGRALVEDKFSVKAMTSAYMELYGVTKNKGVGDK